MDDTAYGDSIIPAVKFSHHTPGRLRIDSNQIGFKAEDIDAICAIGSSSKGDVQESAHSIGEKGIGFKSVFRVADKVWLSSRNYSIRWNRAAELGAMVPEWASFPETVEDGRTSFLFELNRGEQMGQIVDDLKSFDASLLLFLNKIRRVDIEVLCDDGKCWTKSVTRRDVENVDCRISILHDGKEQLHYLKSVFTAPNLPEKPRGHGNSSSELVLAFPLQQDLNKTPSASAYNVFSGLPIGDYGLKVSGTTHCEIPSRNPGWSLRTLLYNLTNICSFYLMQTLFLQPADRLSTSLCLGIWPFATLSCLRY